VNGCLNEKPTVLDSEVSERRSDAPPLPISTLYELNPPKYNVVGSTPLAKQFARTSGTFDVNQVLYMMYQKYF